MNQDIAKIKGFVIQTNRLYQVVWEDGHRTTADRFTVHALKRACIQAGLTALHMPEKGYGYQEMVPADPEETATAPTTDIVDKAIISRYFRAKSRRIGHKPITGRFTHGG